MLALIALVAAPLSLPVDGWIVFEQAAVPGTQRLGCMMNGKASLAHGRDNWMSFSPGESDTGREVSFERFDVFVEFRDGEAQRVRAYTPDCDVAGDAQRADIDVAAGVALLAGIVEDRPERDVASHAIATLAHIAGKTVDTVLEATASDVRHEDVSQQALFWLAQRRGAHGRNIVAEHIDARWPMDHREHAVMSLALSEHADALDTVRDVARTATEAQLRAHAVTALGIVNASGVVADLHSIFLADADSEVRTQAIFGLAQQETAHAAETLVAIIRDPRHDEHRRDALFWLANMEGEAARVAMDELMSEVL